MKRNISLLFGLEFLRDSFYAGIFILLPFIAKDLGLSLTQSGSVQSFIYVIGLILSIPMHYLIEKFNSMRIVIFSLAMFSLTCFGLFYAQNYYMLLGAFLFAGVGICFYGSLAHGLLVKFAQKEQRGQLVGNMMALGDIGKVIATTSVTFVVMHIGWRLLGVILGVIFAVVFTIYELIHEPEVMQKEEKKKSQQVSLKFLLTHKDFVYVLVAGALDMFANIPLYFLLPFFLFYKGLPTPTVGLVTGTYFLGNMISRLVFGRLVDKIGSAKVFIFSEIVMAIVLFFIIHAQSVLFITICAIFLGLITEASDPATVTMSSKIADKIGSFEKVFNMRATVNRVATLIAPILLGLIGDSVGMNWSFYTIMLAVLLATIPTFFLLRNNPKI